MMDLKVSQSNFPIFNPWVDPSEIGLEKTIRHANTQALALFS